MRRGHTRHLNRFARRTMIWMSVLFCGVFSAILMRDAEDRSQQASAASPDTSTVRSAESSGLPFALQCRPSGGSFTLDFESTDQQYLLIINSLGDGEQEFAVRLESSNSTSRNGIECRRAQLRPLPKRLTQSQPVGIAHLQPDEWLAPAPVPKPISLVSLQRPREARESSFRIFHIHVTNGPLTDPAQYTAVVGRRIAAGQTVDVYLDAQQNYMDIAPGLPGAVINALEERVGPGLARSLGRCHDINGDGRFAVLLTPWLSRLQGGKTRLKGFVRSTDFDATGPAPFSNRCDMLYLNSELQPGEELEALIAHEFTHAASLCERRLQFDPLEFMPEDDWVNEAIAHISENQYSTDWQNLDHRIADYLDAPSRYPLVIADYYRAGMWRNHGCRGATYLFMRWCVDTFGESVVSRLVQSQHRGTGNLAQATGLTFDELFRRWTIATAATAFRSQQFGDTYRHIDLTSKIGKHDLHGPRVLGIQGTQNALEWKQHGTTARFVRIAPGQRGPVQFEIESSDECRLQLTVIPVAPTSQSND